MTGSNRLSPYLGRGLVAAFAAPLLFACLLGQVLAADASAAVAESTTEAKSSLKVVEIPIDGMACISCAASVKSAVKAVSGVVTVEVNLEKRNARVTYLANALTPDRIVAAIDKLGYTAGIPRDVP